MNHIILYCPQIPQNTGSIARTCAATKSHLHLVGPLGFSLDEKKVRRAGLDYWPHVQKTYYENWESFLEVAPGEFGIQSIHQFSSKAKVPFWDAPLRKGDGLLFGREDAGLPPNLRFPESLTVSRWTVPIDTEHVRSLNLSVCVGIVLFEALRQQLR